MFIRYPLTLDHEGDAVLVSCHDLPEVKSFGDDEADALRHGADAVAEAIAARLDRFEAIPRPSDGPTSVLLDLQLSMKVHLAWALEEEGKNRADLVRLLGGHRAQVERLFDPDHAARLERYEAAFAALGRRVGFHVEAA